MRSAYIHIPFCARKCLYCDFNSFDNKAFLIDEYIDALLDEIKSYNLNENLAVMSMVWDVSREYSITIENCYGVDGKNILQRNDNGVSVSTCKTFDTETLTFEDNTTLLSALNAWVDANKSEYPELKNWVMDTTAGYPTFAN